MDKLLFNIKYQLTAGNLVDFDLDSYKDDIIHRTKLIMEDANIEKLKIDDAKL